MLFREMLGQREDSENISRDVEVAGDVRLAEGNLPVRAQDCTQRPWIADSPCKSAELPWIRWQLRAVPEFDGKIARMIILQKLLHNGHRLGRGSRLRALCLSRHQGRLCTYSASMVTVKSTPSQRCSCCQYKVKTTPCPGSRSLVGRSAKWIPIPVSRVEVSSAVCQPFLLQCTMAGASNAIRRLSPRGMVRHLLLNRQLQ